MDAYEAYDKQQLAIHVPRPSHRLMAGIHHFAEALRRVDHRLALQRPENENHRGMPWAT